MIKIGVISDTHLDKPTAGFMNIFNKFLMDADIILHAGDITGPDLLDFLRGFNFHGVAGNMDSHEIKSVLPQKLTINVLNFRLGLIHGWGAPWGIEDRISREFDKVDCIVFGHTHTPRNAVKNGVLLFNPGTPTDRRFTDDCTIGILKIGEEIRGEIIRLEL